MFQTGAKSKSNGNRNRNNNNKGKGNGAMAIFGLEHSTHDPKGTSLAGGAKAQYELGLGRWADREDIVHSEVGNLPDFAHGDAVVFFSAADENERANGRRWTEIVLTLPSELDDQENKMLAQEWVREHLGTSHPYVLSVHKPERLRADSEAKTLLANPDLPAAQRRNLEQQVFQPHVHLLFSERTLTPENAGLSADQWFSRKGATKDRAWNNRELIPKLREQWSAQVNGALEVHAPGAARVDHRSLAVQRAEAIDQAHKLPGAEREDLIHRAAVLDREPEGRLSRTERLLVKEKRRGKDLKQQLDKSLEQRRKEPAPAAVAAIRKKMTLLDQMRQACFAAVAQVRQLGNMLRQKKLEMEQAAQERAAAAAEKIPAPEPVKLAATPAQYWLERAGAKRIKEYTQWVAWRDEVAGYLAKETAKEAELKVSIKEQEAGSWWSRDKAQLAVDKDLLAKIEAIRPVRKEDLAKWQPRIDAYEKEQKQAFEEYHELRKEARDRERVGFGLKDRSAALLIAAEFPNDPRAQAAAMEQLTNGGTIPIRGGRVALDYREQKFHASMARMDKAGFEKHLKGLKVVDRGPQLQQKKGGLEIG